MDSFKKRIQATHLEYKDPLTPFSPLFQDVYFAAQAGIAESTHVYLDGTKFAEEIATGNPSITVAEIGFGVGLNFLLTMQAFLQKAGPEQKLHYISFEKHPVYKKDLEELYSRFEELKPMAKELMECYPTLTPGMHSISFFRGRVNLLLCLGEATEMLSRLDAKVNLWYWDGFAPSKNQDAFSAPLFSQVARLSAPNARGSSFTAAGWVRRELEANGFKVEKRTGYGKKRECITAVFTGDSKPSPIPVWFSNQNLKKAIPKKHKIGILGAGLAGSAIARELILRGFEVHVFDPNGIATRASGNSVGLYNVHLSRIPSPLSRFSQSAVVHFFQELQDLKIPTLKGILKTDPDLSQESFETSEYPPEFYQKQKDGVYLPDCGIVNPKNLCERRLAAATVHFIHAVAKVEKEQDHFLILDEHRKTIQSVDHVIYALGADFVLPSNSLQHPLLSQIPMWPVRGQTIEVTATAASRKVSHTLVQQGYVTSVAPGITGHSNHLIGATYQAKEIQPNQEALDTEQLLSEAKEKWPAFSNLESNSVVATREGFRLSTPDKLPMIGPICDEEWMKTKYASAMKGHSSGNLPPLEVSKGEWILMGFSSRGITFSSYAAKILASLMCDEPLPIELDVWEHLHSARFFIRKMKKTTPEQK